MTQTLPELRHSEMLNFGPRTGQQKSPTEDMGKDAVKETSPESTDGGLPAHSGAEGRALKITS